MARTEIWFVIALFAIVAWLSFIVVRPFITALVIGALFAYLFFPVHTFLSKRLRKRPSAIIICLLIVLIIGLPVIFLSNSLVKEVDYLYVRARQGLVNGGIALNECPPEETGTACVLITRTKELLANPNVKRSVEDISQRTLLWLGQQVSRFIIGIPKFLLSVIVSLVTTYFLLLHGPKILRQVETVVPVHKRHKREVMKRLNGVLYGVVMGALFIAIIQGVLGALGFALFGIPSPIVWGLVMVILAILPIIGASAVWIPAGLLILIPGIAAADNTMIIKGIALLAYGLIFIGGVDYILRPMIIGARAKVHPILALLGVLGGIIVFGMIGFILGPLILAFFKAFFDIFLHERSHHPINRSR